MTFGTLDLRAFIGLRHFQIKLRNLFPRPTFNFESNACRFSETILAMLRSPEEKCSHIIHTYKPFLNIFGVRHEGSKNIYIRMGLLVAIWFHLVTVKPTWEQSRACVLMRAAAARSSFFHTHIPIINIVCP
jgi:hypothetical protein